MSPQPQPIRAHTLDIDRTIAVLTCINAPITGNVTFWPRRDAEWRRRKGSPNSCAYCISVRRYPKKTASRLTWVQRVMLEATMGVFLRLQMVLVPQKSRYMAASTPITTAA